MSAVNSKLPDFPGFAVQYNPKDKPYFRSMVVEDLRRIATKEIGRELLKRIANARPRARSARANASAELKAIKFSKGINVVVIPSAVQFTQSGQKMAYTGVGMQQSLQPSAAAHHNIEGCPFHIAGGSSAEAVDPTADSDGTGTVSLMRYTNAQIITSKGESTSSFIVLAHELIHSLHHVTGTTKNDGEELWTTGLGIYSNELMSENAFRKMFGLAPRVDYY